MQLIQAVYEGVRRWHIGRRLRRHLVNWREVRNAYFAGQPLAAFELRDGRRLLHGPGDSPVLLLLEIFDDQIYRCRDECPGVASVLDLGANIGFFSVWASARYPAAQVAAYEPNPLAARQLRLNLQANGLSRVAVHEAAAAGTSGLAAFLPGAGSVFGSLQAVALPEQAGAAPAPPYTVPTRSLADCIEQAGQERIDLCKVDIEGAEVELLECADDRTLRRAREFVIEVHDDRIPGALAACSARLIKAGFKCRARWLAKGRLALLRALRQT